MWRPLFRDPRFSGYIVAGGKEEYHWGRLWRPGFRGFRGFALWANGDAADAAGWDPSRGNDSLHFVRRFAPTSSAVTDSLDFQVADASLQIQFA